MEIGRFFYYVANSFVFFILWNIICIILYLFVFRKYIYSIFDPFLLYTLSCASSAAVVFFMYSKGLITNYYFMNFILTEIAFIIGFFTIRPIKFKEIVPVALKTYSYRSSNSDFIVVLYFLSSFLYIIAQLAVYKLVGIPLLMESRWAAFSGNGSGLLSRVIYVTRYVTIFLLLYRFFNIQRKNLLIRLYDFFIFVFIIITSFLSGSKMTYLAIVFIAFSIDIFSRRLRLGKRMSANKKIRSYQFIIFLFALVAAIGVIVIQIKVLYGTAKINPILALLVRFVKFGDVYILAYPNNVLSHLKWGNPFLALFKDLLGFFRIIPWDKLPEALGLQIYHYIYNTEVLTGPTPRFDVFGLFYFGFYGSVIYSYCIGLTVSFFRNKFYFFVSPNILGGLIYTLFSINSLVFILDAEVAIRNFFDIFLILPVLVLIAYVVSYSVKQVKARYKHSFEN